MAASLGVGGYCVVRNPSSEWQRFRDVRLRALVDAPESFGTTLVQERDYPDAAWIARAADESSVRFVVLRAAEGPEEGVNCFGIARGAPYYDADDSSGGDDGEYTAGLFSMWVDPKGRGLGVGVALIDAVKAWAVENEYTQILLDVADSNLPAIGLYRRCGFLPTGVTGLADPARSHLTEHQMRCELPAPS